ncbi:MAG: hypothetical protein NTW08_00580 [Gammaproteobacteria bacterium]|nr:hypothetical protein [Gammaproteobacteria bacterium]
MNYLTTMIYLWLLLLICTLIGRRIVDLLPQAICESIGFYVSPILGAAALILISTGYGWFSPFKFHYTLMIIVSIMFLSIWYEKNRVHAFQAWAQICLFSIVCALPILAPIILYHGYSPYTDIFTYLAHGQWLQEHAFSEKAIASGFHPYLTQIMLYQVHGLRMGASFLLGFVQSLFSLKWSYYAYIPTIALGFVTGCLSIGGIIRQVTAAPKTVILSLAALPAFSLNGYLYSAQWGFYAQTWGLALATGLCALVPLVTRSMINHRCSLQKTAIYCLPLSICSAALLFAYNEPCPLFAAALGIFFIITGLANRNAIKQLSLFLALYSIETLILINYEGIRIIKSFLLTLFISNAHVKIGWTVPWSPIQYLAHTFGMKCDFVNMPYRFDSVVSCYLFPVALIILCCILLRFILSEQKRNLVLRLIFCIQFILLLVFIKLRYFIPSINSTEVGHTFLQYKISNYATPFSLALVGIGISVLWKDYKKLRSFLLITYLSAMLLGLIFQCVFVSRTLNRQFIEDTEQQKNPFTQLLQLRNALALPPNSDIIHITLTSEHQKLRQMLAYILYDKKLSSDYRDDGYIIRLLPIKDKHMPLDKAKKLITMDYRSNACGHLNMHLKPFLIQSAPYNFINLQKTMGDYVTVKNNEEPRRTWVSNTISYYYSSVGTPKKIKFAFKITAFPYPRKITVNLKHRSGKLMAQYVLPTIAGEQHFETPWIMTRSDHYILQLIADGKPERLSKGDPREVKFSITNMTTICQKDINQL